MFFAPRISTARLADLSRRVSISLEAGLDARTVWAREAERAPRSARRPLGAVSRSVQRGESLAEALAAAGCYFPPLFRALAEVGEGSGHQSEVFAQLADHYAYQASLRRTFWAALTWPLAQLLIAVLVIGFLIWFVGAIASGAGQPIDPLGLGLVGNRGLAIYAAVVVTVALLVVLLVRAVGRGWGWSGPIQRSALRVPLLGRALTTLALARLAWTLHLTLLAGMEVRRALELSLRSAGNARFGDQVPRIQAAIAAGESIHDAFSHAGGYPDDFLDAMAVGEQTGKLVESMALLARQYQERARLAMALLTALAGYAVWAVIAALIIAMIFRLFSFYLGVIQDFSRP